jgi:hypothetical protein
MNTYGGVDVEKYVSLTSVLIGGDNPGVVAKKKERKEQIKRSNGRRNCNSEYRVAHSCTVPVPLHCRARAPCLQHYNWLIQT